MSINLVSADAAILSQAEGNPEINFTHLDLRSHYQSTRNPANAGVWEWTLLNRPHLLTVKAKARILENVLNNRAPLFKVGRVPDAALIAYAQR